MAVRLAFANVVPWLLVPGAAFSVTMSPSPLPIPDGELRLVSDGIGLPARGIVLDGSVAPTDVVLAFELEQFAPIIFGLSDLDWEYALGSPVTPAMTALGTIPGGGVDIDAGVTSPTGGGMVFSDVVATGYTTDVFFIAFATAPLGANFEFGTLSGLLNFATVSFVPEPSTGLLWLVAGASVLAGRRR